MILRNLSLTVMIKFKVVDDIDNDGLVANPLYLKTGNEYISITSGEIFVPKIDIFNDVILQNNIIKNIKHKGDSLAEKYTHNVIEKADIPINNTFTWNNFYNYTLQNCPTGVLHKARKKRCKNRMRL